MALALASCGSAPDAETGPAAAPGASSTVASDRSYAGWYMEQGNGETFQPCGESTPYRVQSSELRARASAFGLGQGNPVYVRVRGRPSPQGSVLLVSSIEAFGSATPVRDCPMTGLVNAVSAHYP